MKLQIATFVVWIVSAFAVRAGARGRTSPAYTGVTSAPQYMAPSPSPTATSSPMPPPQPKDLCWKESRKCCYKEEVLGYECKDWYASKCARCHPKVKYVKKCEKKEEDKPKKPDDRIKMETTETAKYDSNYGPHVQGYPADGCSKTYSTEKLPTRPYGITAQPYAPTAKYY